MNRIPAKFKPASGFSHFVHIFLMCLLPTLVFIFVRTRFYQLAALIIILSKWRMFAVKPRHWFANIRANAVDIIVGLSLLVFMIHSGSALLQFIWAFAYGLWLLLLKPQSTMWGTSLQALTGQFLGLIALFIYWGTAPSYVLVFATWVICYMSARHFFTNFEESSIRFLAYTWGYFAASLVWILSHWLLFYGPVAQPALLLSVIGFGFGGIYFLEKTDRMSLVLRRQIVFVMVAVVVIVITLSDWGDKAI